MQILSATPQMPFFDDREHAIGAARMANDMYAEIVRAHPDRFAALAAVPLPHGRPPRPRSPGPWTSWASSAPASPPWCWTAPRLRPLLGRADAARQWCSSTRTATDLTHH